MNYREWLIAEIKILRAAGHVGFAPALLAAMETCLEKYDELHPEPATTAETNPYNLEVAGKD